MLVYIVKMVKRVVRQYVNIVTEISNKTRVLQDEIVVLKKAEMNIPASGGSSKSKLPKPKSFEGAKSSKKLGNFFWDIKRYFSVARFGVDK